MPVSISKHRINLCPARTLAESSAQVPGSRETKKKGKTALLNNVITEFPSCIFKRGHLPLKIGKYTFNHDVGPTFVGDEWSDPDLMKSLGAEMVKLVGNNFAQYRTEDPPRVVLNKLEQLEYKVISMTGVGQTCIWTLHKES